MKIKIPEALRLAVERDVNEIDEAAKKPAPPPPEPAPEHFEDCLKCHGSGLDGDVLCTQCAGSGKSLPSAG
jgi:hypothetical protein